MNNIKTKNVKCNITGDFNLDLLKHDSNTYVHDYINLMYTYSYLPIINRPTRVSSGTATLIDHIWSNDLESDFKSGILRTDISDHFCLFCFAEADVNNVSSSCRTEIKYQDFS